METPIAQMEPGYTVAFEGMDLPSKFLSFILSVVEPGWRKRKWKPWHLATASKKVKAGTQLSTGEITDEDGWLLIEGIPSGTGEYFHSMKELETSTKVYKWLDNPPSPQRIKEFKDIYLGFPYGVFSYFGGFFCGFAAVMRFSNLWMGIPLFTFLLTVEENRKKKNKYITAIGSHSL